MPRPMVPRAVVMSLAAAACLGQVALWPGSTGLVSARSAVDRAGVVRALADDAVRVDIGAGSEARYVAREVLTGRGFNEAVGRTPDVTGAILLQPDGTIVADQSRISVDLRTLQSDNASRDRYIQRMTLQTDQFPTAEFAVAGAPGLPAALPTSGSAMFELTGDLTVHGVTRPATWQVTATFEGGSITGTAVTDIVMSEFGIEPPRAGPVLSIEDGVRLEIDVRASTIPATAERTD